MALNKYMHPRNVYKTRKPDFKQLALKYDYFRERVTQNLNGKVILEFKEPESLRALTRALLEDDFGLLVTLPVDRLIPTVPQRLNYILWLEDIIGNKSHARGLDIGTGASCIYPLLGCKKNGWEFLASDIDDQNIKFATQNVGKNQLQDKIKIKKVEEDKLLVGVVEDNCMYDFSMCNPPFFSDHLEAQGISSTRSDDRPDPKSVSTACERESIAWGGEVRFVCQMIEESLILKDKIRVYTSMLGKKMSLSLIKDQLIKKKITKFSSTEFCQGRTMRWGIAWTFDESLEFPKSSFKELKKPIVSTTFEVSRGVKAVTDYTVQAFTEFVRTEIEQLKINYHVKHSGKFYTYLILQAKENTWSHQRRKRRKEKFATMNRSDESDNADTSSTHIDCQPKSDEMDNEDSEPVQLNSIIGVSENNNIDCKDSLSLGKTKKSNETNNIKELKNIENTKRKETCNVTSDGSMDVNVCFKRKYEESSAEANVKKCKTENNKDSSKVTYSCDETKGIITPNNSGDHSSKEKLHNPIVQIVSDVKEKETYSTSQEKNTHPQIENAQFADKDKSGIKTQDKQITGSNVEMSDQKVILESNQTRVTEEASVKGSVNHEEDKSVKSEIDNNELKSRDEIIKQFWKEQSANDKGGSKKRVPHSQFEKMESFDEAEECLALIKLMIRKDEGTVTFSLTHMAGKKEAVHQIMQYFKNKLT